MATEAVHRLVGRADELAIASEHVQSLLGGASSVLLLEGQAGIGKSRLVDALAIEAAAAGMRVNRGEAHPFELARPFGAIADALGISTKSQDKQLAATAHLIAGRAASVDNDQHSIDVRHVVVDEIVDIVETLCGAAPTVLVIEDVHWADASTLLALRSLVRHLRHVPLLLTLTYRPTPRSAELDQLLDDLASAGSSTVRLARTG